MNSNLPPDICGIKKRQINNIPIATPSSVILRSKHMQLKHEIKAKSTKFTKQWYIFLTNVLLLNYFLYSAESSCVREDVGVLFIVRFKDSVRKQNAQWKFDSNVEKIDTGLTMFTFLSKITNELKLWKLNPLITVNLILNIGGVVIASCHGAIAKLWPVIGQVYRSNWQEAHNNEINRSALGSRYVHSGLSLVKSSFCAPYCA